MICLSKNFILLGIIGTQEIMILLTALIPIFLIYLVVRFIVKRISRIISVRANIGIAAEIEKLSNLKDKGVITGEDYDDRKSRLL